jgi:hypothetical protein
MVERILVSTFTLIPTFLETPGGTSQLLGRTLDVILILLGSTSSPVCVADSATSGTGKSIDRKEEVEELTICHLLDNSLTPKEENPQNKSTMDVFQLDSFSHSAACWLVAVTFAATDPVDRETASTSHQARGGCSPVPSCRPTPVRSRLEGSDQSMMQQEQNVPTMPNWSS